MRLTILLLEQSTLLFFYFQLNVILSQNINNVIAIIMTVMQKGGKYICG